MTGISAPASDDKGKGKGKTKGIKGKGRDDVSYQPNNVSSLPPPPPPPQGDAGKGAGREGKPCWKFSRGICSLGANCQFVHREMTQEEIAERDELYAKNRGKGTWGTPKAPPKSSFPAFGHSAPAAGSVFDPNQTSSSYQQAPITCPNFSAGNCRFGQNCRNIHDVRSVNAAAVSSFGMSKGGQGDVGQIPYPHVLGYQSYI